MDGGVRLIINIATDGVPYEGDRTQSDFYRDTFWETLESKDEETFVNIRLCTNEDPIVEFYNKKDRSVPNLDVCDDYNSENKEIKSKLGRDMSKGEYILKSVIGCADKTETPSVPCKRTPANTNFDKWDEMGMSGCCTIL